MTKKQYFIPQIEIMPLFHSSALCGSVQDPDSFTLIGGGDPGDAL